jgi:hypothetical protein
VFGVFVVFLGGAPEKAEAQSYEAAEVETVELINAYRQENGLGALSLSAPLSVASERHSEDMGTYGFFSHDTVQSSYYQPGSGHAERAAQEGYDYNTFTAENLAYGQATPQEVFEAWRNSPGHNAAMLGDYSVVGIGLVNIGGVPYWTTVFGAEVDPSASPVGSAPTSGEEPTAETPAEEEPPAQAEQYEDPATEAEPTTSADQDDDPEIEIEPAASEDQYDDAPNATDEEAFASDQYDDTAASDQYDAPETSAADQYLENAEELRAAANQYGEEARQAEAGIAALQSEQPQPTATPAATPTAAPTDTAPEAPVAGPAATPTATAAEAPASSVGAVSPEPQTSAPASAEQEIPVPSVEDPAVVESSGQSGESSGESSGEGSERPSEAMASIGMTVLPDTGGLPLGGILGAALVVCLLVTARRFIR